MAGEKRQRCAGRGAVGMSAYSQRAPRKLEAQGRPEAGTAFEKQRAFLMQVPCRIRAEATGRLRGAFLIVRGKRPSLRMRGDGPALPRLKTSPQSIPELMEHSEYSV